MQEETYLKNLFYKRSKLLVQALMISVTFNIGLIATFLTFFLKKEKKIELLFRQKIFVPKKSIFSSFSLTNQEILKKYLNLPFNDLLKKLENSKLVEQGFCKRDLALSALVSRYFFDIERALSGQKLETRFFHLKEMNLDLPLFPGLDDEKFRAIVFFAHFEKWPFTPQGLFEKLKEFKGETPSSLKETFFLSKEFYLIEKAFNRLPFIFPKEIILKLLLDGNWKQIVSVCISIEENPAGEILDLGAFLSGFHHSKLAAYLLVTLNPAYAYNCLSNKQLEIFLKLLDQPTEPVIAFLKRIVETSLRSNAICDLARQRLVLWENEAFIRPKSPQEKAIEYVIRKGDSLWSLSRRFNISIEELKKANALESTLLCPGKVLLIPKGEERER